MLHNILLNEKSLKCMVWVVLFAPLISALIVRSFSHINSSNSMLFARIACVLLGVSAFCAWVIFALDSTLHIRMRPWFISSGFSAYWAIYADQLSRLMMVIITTVSALVHVYSLGYMRSDAALGRFMSYLGLFTFFMLLLVLSDNFAQLFVGWEGVGLSSYLLIGFWFHKKSATSAAMKAFIVNRVGDIGLALGIFLFALQFGSLEFSAISHFAQDPRPYEISFFGVNVDAIHVICILLFIGCMGKSAQIGLHVWLPDAMEGPTPVSALIHAATMVTAGVFLLARCSHLFEYAPCVLEFIAAVGAITCIFAASIALTQSDIKKIIAYSTCSQLGYMFLACGASAYWAAIFHLFTHAFFKALLFLGAGSVIHALSGEQNIFKMGRLSSKLPYTHAFMLIGTLAITGFPFLSGFFSKDAILEAAYASNHLRYYYLIALFAAFLTSFYSWRLLFVVFHGSEPKVQVNLPVSVHESPKVMLWPLGVLAAGAMASGAIAQYCLQIDSSEFWGSSIYVGGELHVKMLITILPTCAGILGFMLAFLMYQMRWLDTRPGLVHVMLQNGYYFDEVYHSLFVKPAKVASRFLWSVFDLKIIENILAIVQKSVIRLSKATGYIQTGYIYHYATAILAGFIIFMYLYLI